MFLKKHFYLLAFTFSFICLAVSALFLLKGEIMYFSDVARDFLLLSEVMDKKIVLIGPRASGLTGLFHGPLWLYLNLPAYIAGRGNPVVVGWGWFGMVVAFIISSYYIAKKLFSTTVAWIYVMLLSLLSLGFTNGLFNPYGALFIMPVYFFTLVRYRERGTGLYIFFHLLSVSLIIQFQMAVGLPLLFLSTLYLAYLIGAKRKWIHSLFFLTLIFPFSTFILFDIRHDFSQVKSILAAFTDPNVVRIGMLEKIHERLHTMVSGGLGLFQDRFEELNLGYSYIYFFAIIAVFRNAKTEAKRIYRDFLYVYIGFYVMSLFHNGHLLFHYIMPMFSLSFLIFASTFLHINKKFFVAAFILIILLNGFIYKNNIQSRVEGYGRSVQSWNYQKSVAESVVRDAKGEEYGYFNFAPDAYAYQGKYAMLYANQKLQGKGTYLQKKPLTYAILEPAPLNEPALTGDWWVVHKIHITKKPVKTWSVGDYRILQFKLTPQDIAVESDIKPYDWIFFR